MKKGAGGAKRKASEIQQEIKEEATTTTTYMPDTTWRSLKRPKGNSSYWDEPRNMEDLWKAAFPVGTAWDDQLESVYNEIEWDFSNLEQAFKEGGKLYNDIIGNSNKKVYLFGTTERSTGQGEAQDNVALVPVVVAIVSSSPPSRELSFKAVDGEETRIPMKIMKMDWIRYIPQDKRNTQVEIATKKSPQIYVLGCSQRRAALKHLKFDRFLKFQYAVPCLDDHRAVKEEEDDDRDEVDTELEPFKDFFLEQVILVDEFMDADEKVSLMRYVRDRLFEAKRAAKYREKITRGKKMYKFYPVQTAHTPPVMHKSPYINFYRVNAHEVL